MGTFWYDTALLDFFLNLFKFFIYFLFEKSVSYQKKDERSHVVNPSFGMAQTQDIRDLFV